MAQESFLLPKIGVSQDPEQMSKRRELVSIGRSQKTVLNQDLEQVTVAKPKKAQQTMRKERHRGESAELSPPALRESQQLPQQDVSVQAGRRKKKQKRALGRSLLDINNVDLATLGGTMTLTGVATSSSLASQPPPEQTKNIVSNEFITALGSGNTHVSTNAILDHKHFRLNDPNSFNTLAKTIIAKNKPNRISIQNQNELSILSNPNESLHRRYNSMMSDAFDYSTTPLAYPSFPEAQDRYPLYADYRPPNMANQSARFRSDLREEQMRHARHMRQHSTLLSQSIPMSIVSDDVWYEKQGALVSSKTSNMRTLQGSQNQYPANKRYQSQLQKHDTTVSIDLKSSNGPYHETTSIFSDVHKTAQNIPRLLASELKLKSKPTDLLWRNSAAGAPLIMSTLFGNTEENGTRRSTKNATVLSDRDLSRQQIHQPPTLKSILEMSKIQKEKSPVMTGQTSPADSSVESNVYAGNVLALKLKENLQSLVSNKKKEIVQERKQKTMDTFKKKLKKRVKVEQRAELSMMIANIPKVVTKHQLSKQTTQQAAQLGNFKRKLAQAVEMAADQVEVPEKMMEDIMSFNRRFLTQLQLTMIDNIQTRQERILKARDLEDQLKDQAVPRVEEAKSRVELPRSITDNATYGARACTKRMRIYQGALDIMDQLVLDEIQDIDIIQRQKIEEFDGVKLSETIKREEPDEPLGGWNPPALTRREIERAHFRRLRDRKFDKMTQGTKLPALRGVRGKVADAVNKQIKIISNVKKFLHPKLLDRWLYGLPQVTKEASTYLEELQFRVDRGLGQILEDSVLKDKQLYLQTKLHVIECSVSELSDAQLKLMLQQFGVKEEQQSPLPPNSPFFRTVASHVEDDGPYGSEHDNKEGDVDGQRRAQDLIIRENREAILSQLLFDSIVRLTDIASDPRLAALTQLLTEQIEHQGASRAEREKDFEIVRDYVLELKAQLSAASRSVQHESLQSYLKRRYAGSVSSNISLSSCPKLDTIQTLLEELIAGPLSAPSASYAHLKSASQPTAHPTDSVMRKSRYTQKSSKAGGLQNTNEQAFIQSGNNSTVRSGASSVDSAGSPSSVKSRRSVRGFKGQTSGKKILQQSYDRILDQQKQIVQKRKMANSELRRQETETTPEYRLFQELTKRGGATDLRIFGNVTQHEVLSDRGRVLDLTDMQLSSAHCSSLQQVFENCKQQLRTIKTVRLQRNGVKDEDLARLLLGLNHVKSMRALHLGTLDMGTLALKTLKKLVSRRPPNALRELSLTNCKISMDALENLIGRLSKTKQLEKLTFRQLVLPERLFSQAMSEFLTRNRSLTHLELSWCQMHRSELVSFVEVVSENRVLSELNISWNSPHTLTGENGAAQEQAMAESIAFFLKYNRKLQSLNLAGFGFGKESFLTLMAAVRRSFTLVSLNLSGNPFIWDYKLEELQEVFHETIPTIISEKPSQFVQPHNLLKAKDKYERATLSTMQRQQSLLQEESRHLQPKDPFVGQRFLLERKLGHRHDLPGQFMWRVLRDYETGLDHRNEAELSARMKEPMDSARVLSDQIARPESYYTGRHTYSFVFFSKSIWETLCIKNHQTQADFINYYVRHLLSASEQARVSTDPSRSLLQLRDASATFGPANEHSRVAVGLLNSDTARTITITGSGISTAQGDSRKRRLLDEEMIVSPQGHNQAAGEAFMKVREDNIHNSRISLHQTHQSEHKEYAKGRKDEPFGTPDSVPESTVEDVTMTEDTPRMFSASSNWKGQKMFNLLDYLKHLVGHEWRTCEDHFQDLKGMGKIERDILMSELNAKQLKMLNDYTRQYEKRMLSKFETILQKNCRFAKPHVINLEAARRALDADEPVWLLPLFMKPGKQSIFFSQEELLTGELSDRGRIRACVQTTIVPIREEEIALVARPFKEKVAAEPIFVKDQSVFAQWRDNDRILDSDFGRWKLERFIKSEDEQEGVRSFLRANVAKIKEFYTNIQAQSDLYPGISQLAFGDFCFNANLYDKYFTIASADRLFIAANFDTNEDVGDNSANELIRYEFMEILARVVKCKYVDPGLCRSYADGFFRLFKAIEDEYPMVSWRNWRENELWAQPCHNTLHANLELIKKIYNMFASKNHSKKMSFGNIQTMFALTPENHNIRIGERYARICHAMCKMPVQDEAFEMDKYDQLTLVEFLEFIGRAAVYKFSGNSDDFEEQVAAEQAAKANQEMDDLQKIQAEPTPMPFLADVDGQLPLVSKIEMMLDGLFEIYLDGEKRIEVLEDIDEDVTLESLSDEY